MSEPRRTAAAAYEHAATMADHLTGTLDEDDRTRALVHCSRCGGDPVLHPDECPVCVDGDMPLGDLLRTLAAEARSRPASSLSDDVIDLLTRVSSLDPRSDEVIAMAQRIEELEHGCSAARLDRDIALHKAEADQRQALKAVAALADALEVAEDARRRIGEMKQGLAERQEVLERVVRECDEARRRVNELVATGAGT